MHLQYFDFIVVGAGMSGVAVAAELARHAREALVEREAQPGYHATGRSAALFSELYGNVPVRALTRASARLLLFGDPGTLARRSQWQGALDHLDETAGRREQALTTQLVSYIQGHGPHGMAFRLQESGAS